LEQNYPNPVIDATMIRYQLSSAASVRFEVYSLEGKKVASIENKRQDAGTYNFEFNPRQYQLSGGNYIYRLTATDLISGKVYTATKEMIIIK
jgi:flagellar hook assembly protein FlgD